MGVRACWSMRVPSGSFCSNPISVFCVGHRFTEGPKKTLITAYMGGVSDIEFKIEKVLFGCVKVKALIFYLNK